MGLFESLYDPFMIPADWLGLRSWRRWAASVPGERILEVGVGTGLNLPHYSGSATVFALDPEPAMLQKTTSRARSRNGTRVRLLQAQGENLPFADSTFDAAVVTLVFCTIPEPAQALMEIRRVLKPGAPVRLVEHVRLKNPVGAFFLDLLTPAWRLMAKGCHLNRDTVNAVQEAGFRVLRMRHRLGGLLVGIEAIPLREVSLSK